MYGPDPKFYAPESVGEMIEEFHAVMRQVCKARGIACIDLAAVFPKSLDNFYDGIHYTAAGNHLIAKIIYEKLIDNILPKQK